MIHSRIKLIHTKAKYTVRVCKILLTKCVQAHDDCFEVLPHIVLYLLMTRPRTLGSPGLVTPSFLTFGISKNSIFEENEIVSKNRQKIKKKNPYRAAPLAPTKVGAKCLAAVVLAHPDRVLSPKEDTTMEQKTIRCHNKLYLERTVGT